MSLIDLYTPLIGSNNWGTDVNANWTTIEDCLNSLGENRIINCALEIWQRGTTFPAIANAVYTADRFCYIKNSTSAIHTVERSTDVPSFVDAQRKYNYSLKLDCTTADTTVNSTDVVSLRQIIEGYNIYDIVGNGYNRVFTFSFWVKSGKTGTLCVRFAGTTSANPSYIVDIPINSVSTWELKTVTVTAAPSTGTWETTIGAGLYVDIALMVGSSYQASAGSWQSGNFYGTSNQTNFCDNTNSTCDLYFTGFQLKSGIAAIPISFRTIQNELALAQRYYCSLNHSLYESTVSGQTHGVRIDFPQTMRTSPTSVSQTVTGSNIGTAAGLTNITKDGIDWFIVSVATGVANTQYLITASAEL